MGLCPLSYENWVIFILALWRRRNLVMYYAQLRLGWPKIKKLLQNPLPIFVDLSIHFAYNEYRNYHLIKYRKKVDKFLVKWFLFRYRNLPKSTWTRTSQICSFKHVAFRVMHQFQNNQIKINFIFSVSILSYQCVSPRITHLEKNIENECQAYIFDPIILWIID